MEKRHLKERKKPLIHVKKPFIVSLRNLYVLPFTLRKDVLYECLKKLVKIRKEDLNAFFTASLRNRKFKISCCEALILISAVSFSTAQMVSALKTEFAQVQCYLT